MKRPAGLVRPGFLFGIEPGWDVDPGLAIDDTPVKMVFGSFDQTTKVVKIEFCGDNAPLPSNK
jgi:hypothetical protein